MSKCLNQAGQDDSTHYMAKQVRAFSVSAEALCFTAPIGNAYSQASLKGREEEWMVEDVQS